MATETFAPGTLIKARRRLWRVHAHDEKVLLASPIDGRETDPRKFYVPFETIERTSLERPPADRVGHPQALDLLLRAYRLSLLHGSAPLLALQRSRVIVKNYQLVPLILSLEMDPVRLLIADDVGLGKTIEAGLVVTDLLARGRARRLLVVCPANLREQWREALAYFFHIDARVISERRRRQMERDLPPGANPWEYYRSLIVSIDYAKAPRNRGLILEQDWDIVLFDEAHIAAKPHQFRADEEPEMDRWEFFDAVSRAETVRHLLLLTATPHNGGTSIPRPTEMTSPTFAFRSTPLTAT